MKTTRFTLALAAAAALCATAGYAQTPSPSTTTSPESSSSPSQRAATQTQAAEPTGSDGVAPADASTPAQRDAVKGSKPQTMEECMAHESAKNSGISKSQMTNTCNSQMKMQKDYARLSTAPGNAPKQSPVPPADSSK